MNIIVVEDEQLQRETLLGYLEDLYPSASAVGFERVEHALEYMPDHTIDVAILDIGMPGDINGIELGRRLREKDPRVKLLYCSGHDHYAMDAFKLHANGFLQKPVQKEDLMQEIRYILQMPVFNETEKPYIHTFGNFDLFVNNRPVVFKRNKSKEILAYLTDRMGSWVANRELAAALWEDAGSDAALVKYITTLARDMIVDLEAAGVAHIVERKRGRLRLLVKEVACDYFGYLAGDPQDRVRFRSEYMTQYSWAENTLASLLRDAQNNK